MEPATDHGANDFVTALALINGWLPSFAKDAALLYHQLMLLQTDQEVEMGLPPIVKDVWFYHKSFQQEYEAYCDKLKPGFRPGFGGSISTSRELWMAKLGKSRSDLWLEEGMIQSLQLQHERLSLLQFSLILLPISVIIVWPLKWLIDLLCSYMYSSELLGIMIVLMLASLLYTWVLSRKQLSRINSEINPDSFLFSLSSREGTAFKRMGIKQVLVGILSDMQRQGLVGIRSITFIETGRESVEWEHAEVLKLLKESGGKLPFPKLQKKMKRSSFLLALKKARSNVFAALFNAKQMQVVSRQALILTAFHLASCIALVWWLTQREYPSATVVAAAIGFMLFMAQFLLNIHNAVITSVLESKKTEMLKKQRVFDDWDDYYFVKGKTALTLEMQRFSPVFIHYNRSEKEDYDD